MLVGATADHQQTLETAIGSPLPVVRLYGWLDHIPNLTAGAQSKLVVSCKFRTSTGPVKATDIIAGRYDKQLTAFADAVSAAPAPGDGHVLIFEHEPDAQAAAASGTPDELNTAIVHCLDIAHQRPGIPKITTAVCLTGYLPDAYGKPFTGAIHNADMICFDNPYNRGRRHLNPQGQVLAGPALTWAKTNFPGKPIGITEFGSVAFPNRAQWIADTLTYLETAGVQFACYWDSHTSDSDFHLTGTADQHVLVDAIQASQTVTVPKPILKQLLTTAQQLTTTIQGLNV